MLADDFAHGVVQVGLAVQTHDGGNVDATVLHLVLVKFDRNLAGSTTENIYAGHTRDRGEQGLDFVFHHLAEFRGVQRTRKGNSHDGCTVDVHLGNDRGFHGVGEVSRRKFHLGTHVVCRHIYVDAHVEHGDDNAVVLEADGLHVVDTVHQFHLFFDRLDNGGLDFFGTSTCVNHGRRHHRNFEFRHQVHDHHGVGVQTENHHGQDDHEHGNRFINTGLDHSAYLQ